MAEISSSASSSSLASLSALASAAAAVADICPPADPGSAPNMTWDPRLAAYLARASARSRCRACTSELSDRACVSRWSAASRSSRRVRATAAAISSLPAPGKAGHAKSARMMLKAAAFVQQHAIEVQAVFNKAPEDTITVVMGLQDMPAMRAAASFSIFSSFQAVLGSSCMTGAAACVGAGCASPGAGVGTAGGVKAGTETDGNFRRSGTSTIERVVVTCKPLRALRKVKANVNSSAEENSSKKKMNG
ncbi:MAG: hypothetical protein FRX49_00336 [Trebouxia sp. A1-2]|nr:MAG: hypothetical protein FRX49_00336 [Trebouxia sp. A1-2]